MDDTATLAARPIEKIDEFTHRVASKADAVISATQRVANESLDALHGKVDMLRDKVPGTLHRAAAQVDELARQGMERATQAGDRTARYIRDEPLKSVLIAVAAGAALATLIGMLSRSGASTHHHH